MRDPEYYQLDTYCKYCECITLHDYRSVGYENDSHKDTRTCVTCGWTRHGDMGEYKPPSGASEAMASPSLSPSLLSSTDFRDSPGYEVLSSDKDESENSKPFVFSVSHNGMEVNLYKNVGGCVEVRLEDNNTMRWIHNAFSVDKIYKALLTLCLEENSLKGNLNNE